MRLHNFFVSSTLIACTLKSQLKKRYQKALWRDVWWHCPTVTDLMQISKSMSKYFDKTHEQIPQINISIDAQFHLLNNMKLSILTARVDWEEKRLFRNFSFNEMWSWVWERKKESLQYALYIIFSRDFSWFYGGIVLMLSWNMLFIFIKYLMRER